MVCSGASAGLLAGGSRRPARSCRSWCRSCSGFDHAVFVDDRVDHRARRGRGELDAAAAGAELARVAHQRFQRLPGRHVDHLIGDLVGDRERDQPVAVEIEREGVAGRECSRCRASP